MMLPIVYHIFKQIPPLSGQYWDEYIQGWYSFNYEMGRSAIIIANSYHFFK